MAKDAVMIYGLQRLLLPTEPPMMTGKSKKAQGASTVSIPAKNDRNKSDIFF